MTDEAASPLDPAKAELWRQWAIDGMPGDKKRLAEAAWSAAVEAEREACAALISTGKFCRYVEHAQDYCDCGEMAKAIRARIA